MLTSTDWASTEAVKREVCEEDLFILAPYKDVISIMLKQGTHLVYAKHDGTDQRGDIETLKMLCLYRYNKGETQ